MRSGHGGMDMSLTEKCNELKQKEEEAKKAGEEADRKKASMESVPKAPKRSYDSFMRR